MVSYLPWSPGVTKDVFGGFAAGNMPILDLELSAFCGLRLSCGGCLYCDSPAGNAHLNELTLDEIRSLISAAKNDLDLRWLYFCGLGEPSNDAKFLPLIEFAAKQDVSVSFFTNGIGYTRDDLRFLNDHHASLLIKCDSLRPEVFGQLLGVDDLMIAQSIYRTIDMAVEEGFAKLEAGECTRLGLSIVPTRQNKMDILDVVRFCKKRDLFPLLGQLERAGRAETAFDELSLDVSELLEIKSGVEEILGGPYEIPVCPASIAGIHINNVGDCVVHEASGLSCEWHDLVNPASKKIENVRETEIGELWRLVSRYRNSRLQDFQRFSEDNVSRNNNDSNPNVIGGCGGKGLIQTYLRIMDKVESRVHDRR